MRAQRRRRRSRSSPRAGRPARCERQRVRPADRDGCDLLVGRELPDPRDAIRVCDCHQTAVAAEGRVGSERADPHTRRRAEAPEGRQRRDLPADPRLPDACVAVCVDGDQPTAVRAEGDAKGRAEIRDVMRLRPSTDQSSPPTQQVVATYRPSTLTAPATPLIREASRGAALSAYPTRASTTPRRPSSSHDRRRR